MLKKFQHDSDTAKVSIFDYGLWTGTCPARPVLEDGGKGHPALSGTGKPCPLGRGASNSFVPSPKGCPWFRAEAIGARSDWMIRDNTLEFSNSYE